MIPEWMETEKVPSWAREVARRGDPAFEAASMTPIEAGVELQPERCEGAKESLILEGSLGQITLYIEPHSGCLTIINDYAFPGQEKYSDTVRADREFANSVKGTWDQLISDLRAVSPRLRVRADF